MKTVDDSQFDRRCMIALSQEVRRLIKIIQDTLSEHPELTDGDNCTLWRLKQWMDPQKVIEEFNSQP